MKTKFLKKLRRDFEIYESIEKPGTYYLHRKKDGRLSHKDSLRSALLSAIYDYVDWTDHWKLEHRRDIIKYNYHKKRDLKANYKKITT